MLLTAAVPPAAAQTAATSSPTGYDFLQLTVVEGRKSYLTFAPEFRAQKMVELEDVYLENLYTTKRRLSLQALETVTLGWLTEITAAGWELFQVQPIPINSTNPVDGSIVTRYLFRKPRS